MRRYSEEHLVSQAAGRVDILQHELQEAVQHLDEKTLLQLITHARRLAAPHNGDCSHQGHAIRPRVEISYIGLSPFWPAFEDIDYTPEIHCYDGSTGQSLELPLGLRFRITPQPPAAIAFDTLTGAFTGSALLSHTTGAQYQVLAHIEDAGEEVLVGCCAVTFAVLPPELAAIYNDAFQAQEAPAFKKAREASAVQEEQEHQRPHSSLTDGTIISCNSVPSPKGSAGVCYLNPESPPASPIQLRPFSAVSTGRTCVRVMGKPLQSRVSSEAPRWFGTGSYIKAPPALRTRPSTVAGVRSAWATSHEVSQRPASAPQG
eukprot:gnl/MRDRNA2_/MRDRNA2_117699_c0_seq1.p1 gnl/MRDRNA2_/MRDRNA2_117699_c0~~gnl/MRDRNA2_/MRDRNA2_117699_c0_seq1.p1  ORF type:complete len:317 (-),score=39.68 gnl/MRDRNA2_/MRDRNA2_117699_c0_seq1:51-1001(-)